MELDRFFFFFLLSFDCFDFLGLFSSICFGRNALAASSLVGRSIFICSYSLTWLQMMVQRLARPPSSNCSNPFEQAQRCWSCFSSRSIFPHSDTNRDTHTHTVSNFSTSSPAQFFPQNFLSLSRARQNPLFLCVNPSSSSPCSGSASNLHTSVVGCSGAVQVSGLAGASLAAAAAAGAVSREWSSVKWTEPSELSKKRAQTHTRSATRRRDPEQSPERRWTSSSSSARSLPSKSR